MSSILHDRFEKQDLTRSEWYLTEEDLLSSLKPVESSPNFFAELPDGFKWSKLTRIMYLCLTFLRSIHWRIMNVRPVIIVVEGQSGEGKTTLTLWLLKLLLNRYANVDLNEDNLTKYFLLGQDVNVHPRKIMKFYSKYDFIVVDDAYLSFSRQKAITNQNLAFNHFCDLMRQARIFLILTTITIDQLDSKVVNYKNVFRFIVDYNSITVKQVEYDVQLNCYGMSQDGKRNFDYYPYQKDLKQGWSSTNLWQKSREIKYEKGYGEGKEAFNTFNIDMAKTDKKAKLELKKRDIDNVFKEHKKTKDIVIALLELGTSYIDIQNHFNRRFKYDITYKKKTIMNWQKIKEIESEHFE